MSGKVHEFRPRSPDSEKITINLGYVDLGHVDLMVQDGFYSNRTDFIRTAIRNQLDRHADAVRQSVARKTLDLGLRHYSRVDLEAALERGEALRISVLGLASIASDVTPELARAAIASVTVLGALHASPEVRAALADGPVNPPPRDRDALRIHRRYASPSRAVHGQPTRAYRRRKLDPGSEQGCLTRIPSTESQNMNNIENADLLEATRLTNAGRLTEATAAFNACWVAGHTAPDVAGDTALSAPRVPRQSRGRGRSRPEQHVPSHRLSQRRRRRVPADGRSAWGGSDAKPCTGRCTARSAKARGRVSAARGATG